MTRRLLAAGVAAVLMAGLGACGNGDGTQDGVAGQTAQDSTAGQTAQDSAAGQIQPSPETVSGLRDTVRHLSRKTVTDTRAHLVRKCTSATRRVRHTSRSGSGTHRTTRVWYTTEHYQSCRKVRQGTETYRRLVRPERWCVSLDDVNGVKAQDDVWYRVTREIYERAQAADRHTRMEFAPTASGC
ncbi:hypothetical protein [Streptomyces sp. NPDC001137]|uniref:hypothetical protein n=1 Tax=Streptomyces sp. NPDC001137 TaxID=3154378 RepID=UPI003320B424